MKLLQIYYSAAHYREPIYSLIDKEIETDYIFGIPKNDIKQFDASYFRGNVKYVKNWEHFGIVWQRHVVSSLFKKYDTYILLGHPRILSTWLFCILARLFFRKKRVFFWSHGWYGKESKLERPFKKFLFKRANGGIFLYNNHARDLMIMDGFNPDKLWVIHNSLNYDKQLEVRKNLKPTDIYSQHFGNENPNLIFIGRLTPVKHLDLLVEAQNKLKDEDCAVNVTFIGDGSEKERLEALVKEKGLEQNVWFYGACYDEQKNAELIYNADLCVSPGNVGLTAMHTMVFGTPVITHDDFKWQMPEFEAIQEGITGSFFESGNVDSLKDTIQHWLKENNNKRDVVRKACYDEIAANWNPYVQIEVLKKHLL